MADIDIDIDIETEQITSTEDVDSSSKKISELSSLSSLPDDALLVVENKEVSTSYKVQFKDFKAAAFSQLSAQLKLSSMAYEDQNNYALAAHGHDFTDFWFYPSYGPNSSNEQYKSAKKCNVYGRFDIVKYGPESQKSTTSISVCSPQITADIDSLLQNQASIGDLQMLAINCTFESYLSAYRGYKFKDYRTASGELVQNIQINSATFDGYVIPNGAVFTCKSNEFKEACAMYGSGPNAQSFTVPCLSTFFRGFNASLFVNGVALKDMPLRYVKYYNAMPSHTHELETTTTDKELTCDLKNFVMPTSDYPRNKSSTTIFLHGGKGAKSNNSTSIKLLSAKLEGNVTSVNVLSKGTDEESYPRHVTIPVLLYIGNRT